MIATTGTQLLSQQPPVTKDVLRRAQRKTRSNRPAVTPFILLSTQRSGTSWVMERLARHPRIGSYGELLLMNHEGWHSWPPGAQDRPVYKTYLLERGDNTHALAPHRHLFAYLDYVFAPRRDYSAIGFKLMYDEARPLPVLLPYVRSRGVRIVHLMRGNLLDIALSQIAIAIRRSSHAWSPSEREELRVPVSPAHLLQILRRLDRERHVARAALAVLGATTLELDYEALRASDAPMHTLLRFLNVPDTRGDILSATMLKLAPDSHRAGIANYDDVAAALHGTRFARFLRP